jgi:hypothetical protein
VCVNTRVFVVLVDVCVCVHVCVRAYYFIGFLCMRF